jgi:hypothetical protein
MNKRGPYKKTDPEERFWRFVEKLDNGCWAWKGAKSSSGYGKFWSGTREMVAHRFGYELLVGEIPPGLDLDHLCRVRDCVNPDHLEPVTRQENLRRGNVGGYRDSPASAPSLNRAKTHCKYGHEFTPENTYVNTTKRGTEHRQCRTCHRLRTRARRGGPAFPPE